MHPHHHQHVEQSSECIRKQAHCHTLSFLGGGRSCQCTAHMNEHTVQTSPIHFNPATASCGVCVCVYCVCVCFPCPIVFCSHLVDVSSVEGRRTDERMTTSPRSPQVSLAPSTATILSNVCHQKCFCTFVCCQARFRVTATPSF